MPEAWALPLSSTSLLQVGTLVISDDDSVDLTNLQRQIIHQQSRLGWNKAESAVAQLRDINPDIALLALPHRLEGAALLEQIQLADVVLDCSDNFPTRHQINAACVATKTPLVSGAAVRFQGQLAVFDPASQATAGWLSLSISCGRRQPRWAMCFVWRVFTTGRHYWL